MVGQDPGRALPHFSSRGCLSGSLTNAEFSPFSLPLLRSPINNALLPSLTRSVTPHTLAALNALRLRLLH
jgi:hypothetical protein